MFAKTIIVSLLAIISARAAKTDLAGCTLTVVPLLTEIVTTTAANGVVGSFGNYQYTTFQWDGQEQCQLLDCGGGRAPPKSTVPGCPLYTGTDTVPSIPFPTASLTLNTAAAPTSSPAAAPASSPAAAPGSSAPASPVATSAAPAATNTSTPAPVSPTASPDTQSPTAASPESDSGTPTSALNPSTTSNGAVAGAGRGGALLGLAAIAAAVLGL